MQALATSEPMRLTAITGSAQVPAMSLTAATVGSACGSCTARYAPRTAQNAGGIARGKVVVRGDPAQRLRGRLGQPWLGNRGADVVDERLGQQRYLRVGPEV